MSILDNTILSIDSYKASHFNLYPDNAATVYSYIESRGGGDETLFLGPQMFIKRYLSKPITHEHVQEAKAFLLAHGEPFNEAGWQRIVDVHQGRWPLLIKAVKEGTRVPTHNVLTTIENTDPMLPWLTSYIETAYLRACWYPTSVATTSYKAKQILRRYLRATSDLQHEDLQAKLNFMLHDFGARGVSSKESAEIGGVGHLVNFQGTDTIGAVLQAQVYYGEPMAGFSIAASEHAVVTSWGRDHELDFYRHQLAVHGKPGTMFASVIDSYDQAAAIRDLWGGVLRQELIASGAKLILRPDSGDPLKVLPRLLDIAGSAFGYTTNCRHFKLLPSYVGMLQGDGITLESLPLICRAVMDAGWSLENLAFGMGGGLLQQVNRDTHRFAMKASAICHADGSWHDVFKAPVDDPGKRSQPGRFGLYPCAEGYRTGPIGLAGDALEPIFNGELLRDQSFAEIRQLAT